MKHIERKYIIYTNKNIALGTKLKKKKKIVEQETN